MDMFEIVHKKRLNPTVTEMDVMAPLVAAKARAGQFVILRVDEDGERIPLTVAGFDRDAGTVRIIYQIVGATTMRLDAENEGDSIRDFVGPLGNPTDISGVGSALIVGGGVGCAIALPVARALCDQGSDVRSIIGFRNKDLVILEKEFRDCSSSLVLTTDDGSAGRKGLVTELLRELLESGERFDRIYAIGPLVMMKYVVKTASPYGVPVVVSMNPIMIDGTGMCGCCRLSVGGQMKFACVDGPDFEGALVNFDEAISRSSQYKEQEDRARETACNLFKKEVR